MAIRGFAAAEVEEVLHARARALRAAGRVPAGVHGAVAARPLPVLRAELHAAYAIAEQLLELARDATDTFVTIEAHRACGVTLVDLGRFEEAIAHLDTVTRLYEAARRSGQVSFAGQDPNVIAECYAARALWALGEPDQALARVERALSFARELSHVETLVIATRFRGAHPSASRRGVLDTGAQPKR